MKILAGSDSRDYDQAPTMCWGTCQDPISSEVNWEDIRVLF